MRSDLFKYTPFYKEEMSIIYKAIKESDRLLIRAPPGSGKTTAAIVYAIERALSGERTAIFLRTENEIYKAVKILKTILNKSGIKVKWSFVMGKEKLCVFKNLKVLNLSNELYRFVCFSSGCRLRYKTGSIDLNSIEPEEAYDELSKSGFCPYYSLIDMAKDSKILIAQHNQITQFIHTFDNLIIDEAHSFTVLYKIMSKKAYIKAKNLIKRYGVKDWVIANFLSRPKTVSMIAKYLDFEEFSGFEVSADSYKMKITCPKLLLKNFKGRIIAMSSTMYPIRFFKKLWGIKESTTIGDPIGGSRKVVGLVLPGISTRYESRTEAVFKAYSKIVRLIRERFGDVIIFTPSYEVGKALSNLLKVKISRDEWGNGTVLTVMRGKLAEGIEPRGRYKIALAVGLPYPKVEKILIKALKVLGSAIGYPDIVSDYFKMEMFSPLIQALGRVGRLGKGLGIIIDYRAEYLRDIPVFTNINSLFRFIRDYFGAGNV